MRPLTYLLILKNQKQLLPITSFHFISQFILRQKNMSCWDGIRDLLNNWSILSVNVLYKNTCQNSLGRQNGDPLPDLQNNDVVKLCDDSVPRNTWRKAMMEKEGKQGYGLKIVS